MKALLKISIIYLCSITAVFSAVEEGAKQTVTSLSYAHVLNWTLGLIFVLALFLSCVWVMKKMGALPTNIKDGMKIIGGLSLGVREKIILVQIGEKQLVLAVTPGRVEKLLVLEGEDILFQQSKDENTNTDFSQKLKQIMSGTVDE